MLGSLVRGVSRSPVPLVLLAGAIVLAPALPARAVDPWRRGAVGGIAIDADGVVRQLTAKERVALVKEVRAGSAAVPEKMALPSELRKVSLRGVEAALRDLRAKNLRKLPDEIAYLAGIQRVQYVLIYPQQHDIVLAGPGEGWKVDDEGHCVGLTTGRPTLLAEDLLVAFQSADAARTEGMSVSIEPTAEGRRGFEQFMDEYRRKYRVFDQSVLAPAAAAMGNQQILLTGVQDTSHVARVLVSADFHMKCIAMKLTESGIQGLPSYLDLLKAKRRLPTSATPRWWMACHYEPLARTEDRLAWQLRGPGVKCLTENDFVAPDGRVRGSGKQDPTAKEWADRMTEHYDALSQKNVVFGELRNIMDLCVVAALIKKENLAGLAGCELPNLLGKQCTYGCDLHAAKTTATQCSFLRVGNNYVITASGGVDIDSWAVAGKQEVDATLQPKHAQSAPAADAGWWWN